MEKRIIKKSWKYYKWIQAIALIILAIGLFIGYTKLLLLSSISFIILGSILGAELTIETNGTTNKSNN